MANLFDDDENKMDWLFGEQQKPVTLDTAAAPDDKAKVVKDYLMNKYGPQIDAANSDFKPTSTASKALNAFGSVLSRQDPTKGLEEIDTQDETRRKRALAPIDEKIKTEQMFEKDDQQRTEFGQKQQEYEDNNNPTSPKSKAFQDYLKQIDGKDHSGQSYADLKEISPLAEKLFDAKQRSADRQVTRETNKTNKDIANSERQRREDEKIFNDAFQTAQGVKRGSSSGLYGTAMKNVAFAENGLRNIELIKNGKIAGNENVAAELAADLNRLLSGGGTGADAGIKRLIPESMWGSVQDIKEYILGKPQQFLTDSFLQQMEHQFEGQKDFWKEQRNKVTDGYEVMLEPVFERNPAMKARWERYWINDADKSNPEGGASGETSGQVRIRDPKGNIRLIPAAQKEAALAAGGTLVGGEEESKAPKKDRVVSMRESEGW